MLLNLTFSFFFDIILYINEKRRDGLIATVSKKDLNEIKDFVVNGTLVTEMNDKGLSVPAMGFILESLLSAIEVYETKVKEEIVDE